MDYEFELDEELLPFNACICDASQLLVFFIVPKYFSIAANFSV
jgi:hypothetical protein